MNDEMILELSADVHKKSFSTLKALKMKQYEQNDIGIRRRNRWNYYG